jgi:hypothetical protein
MSELEDRSKALRTQNPRVTTGLGFSQLVKDVFAKRVVGGQGAPPPPPSGVTLSAWQVHQQQTQGHYLPQGAKEPNEDYKKRLSITPFLPESPEVLNSRRGALFESPPKMDMPDSLKEFVQKATARGEPLMTVIARVHERLEIAGWCGLLVHRLPAPEEARQRNEAGTLTAPEAAQLNRPVVTMYRDRRILDYEFDMHGLTKVRLLESTRILGEETTEVVIRVIDALNVTDYKITERKGQVVSIEETLLPHGATVDGRPALPFVFASSPLQIEDDDVDPRDPVAFPLLYGGCVADIAATRLGSDIRWCLFVLGQPILTLKSLRDEKELKNVALGVGRYFHLRAARGDEEGEALEFVQLDSTGLELQIAAYEADTKRAKELGGKGGDAALQVPVTESGVSRAWRFKTGEERLLFLLANRLQEVFERVLDLVAGYSGIASDKVSIQFHTDFSEDASPSEIVDLEGKVMPTWEKYRCATPLRLALLRLFKRLYPSANETDEQEFIIEIGEAITRLSPETEDTLDGKAIEGKVIEGEDKAIEGEAVEGVVEGSVQETGLNGAQIQALVDLASAVAEGQLPAVSAKAIARTSLPFVRSDILDVIFSGLEEFQPEAPPAKPQRESEEEPVPRSER